MAEPERLVLQALRDVPERCRARRPRDVWQKAVYLAVLWVVLAQPVAPQQALLAALRAQADESELLQAQALRERQASRPAAPLQVRELAPWVLLERRARGAPGRLGLLLAQRGPPG